MTTPFARATACGMGTGPAPMSSSGSEGSSESSGATSGGAYGSGMRGGDAFGSASTGSGPVRGLCVDGAMPGQARLRAGVLGEEACGGALGLDVGGEEALDAELLQRHVLRRTERRDEREIAERQIALLEGDGEERRQRDVGIERREARG